MYFFPRGVSHTFAIFRPNFAAGVQQGSTHWVGDSSLWPPLLYPATVAYCTTRPHATPPHPSLIHPTLAFPPPLYFSLLYPNTPYPTTPTYPTLPYYSEGRRFMSPVDAVIHTQERLPLNVSYTASPLWHPPNSSRRVALGASNVSLIGKKPDVFRHCIFWGARVYGHMFSRPCIP